MEELRLLSGVSSPNCDIPNLAVTVNELAALDVFI
jgi:hypothetical protein